MKPAVLRAVALALALLNGAMPAAYAQGAAKPKSSLNAEIDAKIPDNTTGSVTPALVRDVTKDIVASTQQYTGVNAQVGTTYTVQASDYGQLVTFNNTASVAVTLPNPATSNPFNFYPSNVGSGVVTLTASSGTIAGATTFQLSSGQSAKLVSDGTNWQITSNFSGSSISGVLDLKTCMNGYYGAGGWSYWTSTGTGTDIGPALSSCLTQLRNAKGRGVIWIDPGQWAYHTPVAAATISGNFLIGAGSQASTLIVQFTSGCVFCYTGVGGLSGGGVKGVGVSLDANLGTTTVVPLYLVGDATGQADQTEFSDLYITGNGGSPHSYYAKCFDVDGTARTAPQGARAGTWTDVQCFESAGASEFKAAVQYTIVNLGLYTGTGTGNNLNITGAGTADTNTTLLQCIRCTVNGDLSINNSDQVSFHGSAANLTFATTATNVKGEYSISGSVTGSAGTNSAYLLNGTVVGTSVFPNQTANTVFAGPTTGAAAAPAFRALVGADLPNPSATTLGGVKSLTLVAHQWINSISTAGAPAQSQPAFSDISGTIATGQVSGSYTGITGVGTLTAGATGAGFTVALGTSTITGNLPLANLNSPGGNLNRFRNGTFDVWQRGTSALTTAATLAKPCVATADGWCVAQTGAQFTCLQDTGNNGTLYSLRCVGGTSNTGTAFTQRIESNIAAPLAGQTVTVQFRYKQDTGGSITPKISTCYASATDNFTTCTSDLAATSLSACATGTWCTEAYTLAVSSNASNGYSVTLDCNSALTAAQHCWITAADIRATPGVSTGVNTTPPPAELRLINTELIANQRYFYAFPANGISLGIFGSALIYSSVLGVSPLSFPVIMRTSPTVVVSAGTTFQIPAGGGAFTGSGIVVGTSSPGGVEIDLTISGATAGQAGWLRTVSGQASSITASAEL